MNKAQLKQLIKEVLLEASVDPDIKQFAAEILQKVKDRIRRVGNGRPDLNMPEAIRQMIEHKLTKEGWVKGENKPTSSVPDDTESYFDLGSHKLGMDKWKLTKKQSFPPSPRDVRNVDPTDIKL